MSGFLNRVFGIPNGNPKLDGQIDKMDKLHGILKEATEEVESLRKILVKKANGSLPVTK
jgi:hypothetical protein